MGVRTVFSNESWSVEFSPARKCVIFSTTDYHAEPLCLTEDQWRAIGREFGKEMPSREVQREAEVAPPAVPPPSSAPVAAPAVNHQPVTPKPEPQARSARPADWVEVATTGPWIVGISRRKKEMTVECRDSSAAALSLPRKELYRLGKRMGKRGT